MLGVACLRDSTMQIWSQTYLLKGPLSPALRRMTPEQVLCYQLTWKAKALVPATAVSCSPAAPTPVPEQVCPQDSTKRPRGIIKN